MLSEKKKKALRKMKDYLPSLKKGQFNKDGDLNMDELLGNASLVVAKRFTVTADPTDIAIVGLQDTHEVAIATLVQDDTGGTLGAVAVSIPSDGLLRIDPANPPTNNDGLVYVMITRDLV